MIICQKCNGIGCEKSVKVSFGWFLTGECKICKGIGLLEETLKKDEPLKKEEEESKEAE